MNSSFKCVCRSDRANRLIHIHSYPFNAHECICICMCWNGVGTLHLIWQMECIFVLATLALFITKLKQHAVSIFIQTIAYKIPNAFFCHYIQNERHFLIPFGCIATFGVWVFFLFLSLYHYYSLSLVSKWLTIFLCAWNKYTCLVRIWSTKEKDKMTGKGNQKNQSEVCFERGTNER